MYRSAFYVMLGCCDCFRLSNCVTLSSQIHRVASGHTLTVDMLKQYESQIENIKRTLPKIKSMMCRDLRWTSDFNRDHPGFVQYFFVGLKSMKIRNGSWLCWLYIGGNYRFDPFIYTDDWMSIDWTWLLISIGIELNLTCGTLPSLYRLPILEIIQRNEQRSIKFAVGFQIAIHD